MTALKKVKSHPDVVDYFKELSFYNKHIKKPKIKGLKNLDLLSELPFYEELNVIKINHAFRGYAMSYKIEKIEKKDPIKHLEASKSSIASIKDSFSGLLNEANGFNLIQDGLSWGCSRMVGGGWGAKSTPSIKSVTHILQ